MTGILPINKPSSVNSRKVTTAVKWIFGAKTGHSGTLDPLASGVLPILLGNATKLSDYMLEDKAYTAVIKLGIATDTCDITGKIIDKKTVILPSREEILAVLKSFIGATTQIPPMYSALKHEGKSLYTLARNGITIERQPREIVINEILLLENTIDEIKFSVSCKKGTYIRILCEDIAKKLNNIGTMKSLIRTKSCNITLDKCLNFAELENKNIDEISKFIITPEQYLRFMPTVIIPENGLNYYKNGGFLDKSRIVGDVFPFMRAYSEKKEFIGIAKNTICSEIAGIKSVWKQEN